MLLAGVHGVGMVLLLPATTVLGVPPDINSAAGGEAGDGGRMAGAERPTVMEVLGPEAGADIEPVGGILTGMAASKGDGGRR